MNVVSATLVVSDHPATLAVPFVTAVPLGFPVPSSVSILTSKLSAGVPVLYTPSFIVVNPTPFPIILMLFLVFALTFPMSSTVVLAPAVHRRYVVTMSSWYTKSPAVRASHAGSTGLFVVLRLDESTEYGVRTQLPHAVLFRISSVDIKLESVVIA